MNGTSRRGTFPTACWPVVLNVSNGRMLYRLRSSIEQSMESFSVPDLFDFVLHAESSYQIKSKAKDLSLQDRTPSSWPQER